MVKFENALDVRPLDDGSNWMVLEDFYYDTDVSLTPSPHRGTVPFMASVQCIGYSNRSYGFRICIPKGFVTDFASIPRPLWPVVGGPADGKYRKIAVVHDGLYRGYGLATRGQADRVLLEGMKFSGCSWHQRWAIYSGVRVGGWASYKGDL